MPTLTERMPALQAALLDAGIEVTALSAMPDTGLAHDHVWLHRPGQDWVARLPKQSQMNLAPADNLAYEAACYQCASQAGHAPRLHQVLDVSEWLPRGALLVDAIHGRLARLPDDLEAIALSLARLHGLAIPSRRLPIQAPVDPWQAMRDEVIAQSDWLEAANLAPSTLRRLKAALESLPATLDDTASCLISFDTHSGNFLIDEQGRAILVDLEKCRYGLPGIDLAHTTLYTSTTWDLNSQSMLSDDDILGFYRAWQAKVALAPSADNLIACRQATWLWSLTWCAKWRAQHRKASDARHLGQDWSAELSDQGVIAHVRERVAHYLSDAAIQRVQDELDALARRL